VPTYRLDFAYHGAGFYGYAAQPDVRTVQQDLETALAHHSGPVTTLVSGRTDKGVHASAQVVSFTSERQLHAARVVRSLNRQLGPEIAVYSLTVAPDDFHARFSATGRAYTYLVLNRDTPDPLRADVTWHVPDRLDLAAMNDAAGHLVGQRDFASFCRKAAGRSTIRDVRTAEWSRRGDLVRFDIAASSFCHQMVRSIVALGVDVGRGRIATEAVPDIIGAGDRHLARGVAPPRGLTLVRVEFGGGNESADHPV
jgi:tRNA pseudouridine38-40 synthase